MFYTETITMNTNEPSLLEKFLAKMNKTFSIIGYSRAMHEFTRIGRYEEANFCAKEIQKLRSQ